LAVSWRHSLAKAALASLLGLGLGFGLAACGGGEPTDAVNSTTQGFTVVGADKASVSFSESAAAKRASQVTFRVARNSTGAPSLQADQTPLGPVYQFTPLDLADDGIEIRIPVSAQAAAHGKPVLHVATLGGEWQTVSNAKRDGEFIVAKVPSLSYATLATASSTSAGERMSRLAASASPSAPVITSGSGAQTVLVGQTATFTVTGTGNPKPTVTWQRRHVVNFNSTVATTSSFPISEEQDWVEIDPGWTKSFYTTGANTLANSGDEYRAVLTNSQGTATSLPASLRVLPQVTAPAITTAPLSQTVQAGQTALFTVAASGTSPLSYQWFKNGVAVVAANSTSLAIPVSAAEAGTAIQVTVQISNSAGSVTSAAATLTVVAAPPTAGGTLITAAEGGTVAGGSTGEEASLYVAPGALSADTTILLTTEPLAPSSLPAGVTAMSDIVEINPAGLAFLKPASLTIQVKQNVPANNALAVLKLDASNTVLGEIRRTALSYKPIRATAQASGRMTATAFNLPPNLSCLDQQFVDSGNNFKLSAIGAAVRTVLVAVPQSMCSAIALLPESIAPVDTSQGCTEHSQFGAVGNKKTSGSDDKNSLVNRHGDCRLSESTGDYIGVYMLFDENSRPTRIAPANTLEPVSSYIAVYAKFEFEVTTFGKSSVLGKTMRYRARAVDYRPFPSYEGPNRSPKIYLRPNVSPFCNTVDNYEFRNPSTFTCGAGAPSAIEVSPTGAWSKWSDDFQIKVDLTLANTANFNGAFFDINLDRFEIRIEGTDADFKVPSSGSPFEISSDLRLLPRLRCDKGLAKVGSNGGVFYDAAAVYVLDRTDDKVKQAAEHIFEAQNNPDENARSPGKFLLEPGARAFASGTNSFNDALKRTAITKVRDKNNYAACAPYSTSLIGQRPPYFSATCAAPGSKCDCDEYPFASTWNGAKIRPYTTSVKKINSAQNQLAGSGLAPFFLAERIIDFSDPAAWLFDSEDFLGGPISADNFFVHIK
jgi:hypothetical protein